MRVGLTLLTLSFLTMPAQAEVKLVQLSADQNHRMSEVWDGQFRALDGSRFDISQRSTNPVKLRFQPPAYSLTQSRLDSQP